MTKRSKVVVIRSAPERVLEDIKQLTVRAGLSDAFDKNSTTILKENISWHYPFPGANTTPWQLEGTILALQAEGFKDIVCVGNNTVVTNPFKGERLCKLKGVFNKYEIPLLYNFRPADIQWETYEPKADLLVLHQIYPKGIKIPTYFKGKNIIHLPTMKTHIYTTTTGAMKNAFGGLLNTRRHYTHSVIHETLVDLLAIQQEIHKGIFAVMDGTICGSGPGPRTMVPIRSDLLLASSDSVAIDAVAAKIMGFDPMTLDYIRLAHERGLGTGRIEEIEVIGEDISELNLSFPVGDNLASKVGDLFWFSPLKIFQRMLFRTPLVYTFILGSYIYHDFYWWPSRGRAVLRQICRDDPWGRLFEQYEE
ncbi:MAG: DUF362 domain-containing protein [Deltaproteobacteria bacterium]|nr:DUF362 domain-containing protein [Deltaproteobacteria bacterium]